MLQLEKFAKENATEKIFVYIEKPSAFLNEFMKKHGQQIDFWDSERLTSEIFRLDLRFYLFLIIENYIESTSYDITYSFCQMYRKVEDGTAETRAIQPSDELLNLLWNAKDRSSSLHKSARTLQEVFENTSLNIGEMKIKEPIVKGYLKGLLFLSENSLKPLRIIFKEILTRYPEIFVQYCIQTKGRSNWIYFFTHNPTLLPTTIIEFLKKSEKELSGFREFLKNKPTEMHFEDSFNDILSDVSRIMANEAQWLEDTVDTLLSIYLFKDWKEIRNKTPNWLRFWEFERGLSYRVEHEEEYSIETGLQPGSKTNSRLPTSNKIELQSKQDFCFVIMPFKKNFFRLYENCIKPTLEHNGFEAINAGDLYYPTPFNEDIKKYIKMARFVIADVTNDVPNVLYELGFAHAADKETVIITQDENYVSSDFKHVRYFKYDDDKRGWNLLKETLNEVISSIKAKDKGT